MEITTSLGNIHFLAQSCQVASYNVMWLRQVLDIGFISRFNPYFKPMIPSSTTYKGIEKKHWSEMVSFVKKENKNKVSRWTWWDPQ